MGWSYLYTWPNTPLTTVRGTRCKIWSKCGYEPNIWWNYVRGSMLAPMILQRLECCIWFAVKLCIFFWGKPRAVEADKNDFVHPTAAKHPALPRTAAQPDCGLCVIALDQKRFVSCVKLSLGLWLSPETRGETPSVWRRSSASTAPLMGKASCGSHQFAEFHWEWLLLWLDFLNDKCRRKDLQD